MKDELLELLKKDAFFRKKVILSSGKESDYYIDVRRVSLSSRGIYLISSLIWEMIKDDRITAIGGPTLGADPIVSGVCLLAYQNNYDLKGFIVRREPKKHGQQQLIEGKGLLPQDRVVLVDDVATSGSSIVKALDVIESIGSKVERVVVVVDREEGAADIIRGKGYIFSSLFTRTDFGN